MQRLARSINQLEGDQLGKILVLLFVVSTVIGIIISLYKIVRVMMSWEWPLIAEFYFRQTAILFHERLEEHFIEARAFGKSEPPPDIHICDSRRCAYVKWLYDIPEENDSQFGFCPEAVCRLSTPSGVYQYGNVVEVEENFTYNRKLSGFPIFDRTGKWILRPKVLTIARGPHMTVFGMFLNWVQSFCGVDHEKFDCDPLLWVLMCNERTETKPSGYNALDISKTVFRKIGSVFKDRKTNVMIEARQYWRYCVGVDCAVVGEGVYPGRVFYVCNRNRYVRSVPIELGEVHVECAMPPSEVGACSNGGESNSNIIEGDSEREEKKREKEEEEVFKQGIEHVEPFYCDIDQAEELIVKKLDGPILVPELRGVKTDQSDIADNRDFSLEYITVNSKGKVDERPKAERAVEYGLICGERGAVYQNSPKQTIAIMKARMDERVPEPTMELYGEPLAISVKGSTDHYKGRFIPKDRIFGDLSSWTEEKFKKMTKIQRQRAERIVNTVFSEGVWVWKKQKVKFFPKGDEVYMKRKGRIITFVPTLAWFRMVLILDEFLKTIKGEDHKEEYWRIENFTFDKEGRKRRIDLYWASGMTQEQLGKSATEADRRWREEGVYYFFVCGDDNTNPHQALDGSRYDATQTEKFFNLQAQMFVSRFEEQAMPKVESLLKDLFKYHSGVRETNELIFKNTMVMLPSGGPHTLVFNTLGMMVAAMVWWEALWMDPERQGEPNYMDFVNSKYVREMEQALGLTMTTAINPCIGGDDLNGAEFLKGFFVRHGEEFKWVPAEGRICKVGKAIVYAKEPMKAGDLQRRIRAVADGYKSFYTGPLLNTFHVTWRDGTKGVLPYEWTNIYGDANKRISDEDRVAFLNDTSEFWYELYEKRYRIDRETLNNMVNDLGKNGQSFAEFSGNAWTRLVRADYRGETFE